MIRLPKPPLIAVSSITYVDACGLTQTLDPSLYLVHAGGITQGVIAPAYGKIFPPTRCQLDAVKVTYTAGYGPASAVPQGIVQAILLCIGHWYEHRTAVAEGSWGPIPRGVEALLAPYSWGSYA